MKNFVFLILFVAFFACAQSKKLENQYVPNEFIAPKKMKELLCAIHLAEARTAESAYQIQDSAGFFFLKETKEILKKYKIDSVHFQKSFAYYNTQPELVLLLYNQVVDSLKKIEAKIKKQEESTLKGNFGKKK